MAKADKIHEEFANLWQLQQTVFIDDLENPIYKKARKKVARKVQKEYQMTEEEALLAVDIHLDRMTEGMNRMILYGDTEMRR
jgi:hypothetical protein